MHRFGQSIHVNPICRERKMEDQASRSRVASTELVRLAFQVLCHSAEE